jgi:hypothetical protein
MFDTDVRLPWLVGRPEPPADAVLLPSPPLLRPGMAGSGGWRGMEKGATGAQWLGGMLDREM